MDRREALKLMGASLAAVAMAGIAPRTHAAILKDRAKNKKRLVFYFTATGNSLFVARQFSDSPISIPQELKKKDLTYEADEIGIVCPDYAGAIPKIVREFVQKASFKAPSTSTRTRIWPPSSKRWVRTRTSSLLPRWVSSTRTCSRGCRISISR